MQSANSKKPVIIVGTPKSATMYIATVLNKMGLDFQHEHYAKDGFADWRLAPKEKSQPWDGYTDMIDFKNTIILHQIRNPLDTMSSMQQIGEHAWKYITAYIPVTMEDSIIKRCMATWYHWNLLAESISCFSYRIEDFEKTFPVFCKKIHHPELIKKQEIIQTVPKNINTAKPYNQLTWKHLIREDHRLTRKIWRLAKKYGYI